MYLVITMEVTMSPENFCYWLQGYVELNKAEGTTARSLSVQQMECVQDHLALVLDKKTPEVKRGYGYDPHPIHLPKVKVPPSPLDEVAPSNYKFAPSTTPETIPVDGVQYFNDDMIGLHTPDDWIAHSC
jgi:hypothetical protein